LSQNNYYEHVTTVEKIRTAKDVICSIFLLNPEHLRAHLNNDSSITDITNWCESIKSA